MQILNHLLKVLLLVAKKHFKMCSCFPFLKLAYRLLVCLLMSNRLQKSLTCMYFTKKRLFLKTIYQLGFLSGGLWANHPRKDMCGHRKRRNAVNSCPIILYCVLVVFMSASWWEVPSSSPTWVLSVWSMYVLTVHTWALQDPFTVQIRAS